MWQLITTLLTITVLTVGFAISTSSRISVVETRQSAHEKVIDRIHQKLDTIDKYIRNK